MTMTTDFDPWMNDPKIPVPVVDPADLRKAWALQSKVGTQGMIGAELYRDACSPGANVGAVWYRLSQLIMFQMYSQVTGKELPWLQPEPHDVVFKVLATLPLTSGKRNFPASQVEELVLLIQKDYEASRQVN
jgi:hypothetical protein